MPGLVDSNPAPPEPQEKKPLKPCCACPETKKARDAGGLVPGSDEERGEPLASTTHSFLQIIIEKGEEHCGHLIEAHKECMRALGFKI
uniref:Cytochrome c oxidase copper chaperone COX17 n=1 Tax=Macaca nemestrina TaxID=9545 RepID=A0A2K6CNP1_MACNE